MVIWFLLEYQCQVLLLMLVDTEVKKLLIVHLDGGGHADHERVILYCLQLVLL